MGLYKDFRLGQALKSRIEEVVSITQLSDLLNQQAHTYSGGLKRRLNIAIGLLSNPKIIYLDEPTVGIDPQSRNFILESIKAMKSDNRVIVYTSHYMEEVEFLCDKIAIIDHGEILRQGTLSELLTESKVFIETQEETLEVEIDALPNTIQKLLEADKTIKSIEYGHNLEKYFLQLTNKALRE